MKKTILFLTIIIFSTNINAQYQLIAHYPFYNSATDTTGNYSDATLLNTVFSNGGIYSNGIYSGGSLQGSVITTDLLTGLDLTDFAINLQFRIDSFPTTGPARPIIVCGPGWRWMAAYIHTDSTLSIRCNDGMIYKASAIKVTPNAWHDLSLAYDTTTKTAKLIFDIDSVISCNVPTLNHNNDKKITNENGGMGFTFKGYWKDLKILNKNTATSFPDYFKEPIQINIYPNPADRYIVVNNQNSYNVHYQLIDIIGNIVNENSLTQKTKTQIPVNKPGVYVLKIFSGKQSITRKIIINN